MESSVCCGVSICVLVGGESFGVLGMIRLVTMGDAWERKSERESQKDQRKGFSMTITCRKEDTGSIKLMRYI